MDRPPDTDLHSALQAEQVRVLYRTMPMGLVVSAANAALLAAVEWPVASHLSLLLWVFTIWIVAGARALLIVRYRRGSPSSWQTEEWYRWMLAGTTLSGMAWGSSVYFFMPEIPFPYEVVQMFALGGMTAGAISLLSVSFSLFLYYALALGLPLLAHLFLSGHDFHSIMGIIGTLFLCAIILSAWQFNRVILSSMSLRLEKLSLVQSLTTRTEAVERLNQEITKEIHERRIIEEQLRTTQNGLAQRIAERTADLAQANIRLQE